MSSHNTLPDQTQTPIVRLQWVKTVHKTPEELLLLCKHMWGHTPKFTAAIQGEAVFVQGYGVMYNRSVENPLKRLNLDKYVTWQRRGLADPQEIEAVENLLEEFADYVDV